MPAYVDFDPTQPDATTDAGTNFGADLLNNLTAVRDAIIAGFFKGYLYSQSGGTAERPGIILLTKGAHIIRLTLTWTDTGGGRFNITTAVVERSLNTGGAYDALVTIVFTYDGSGNLTATTGGGAVFAKFLQLWGMATKALADLAAHTAATGTAVHGLGTMATQAAAAIAVTGGTLKGTVIGGTGGGEAALATFAAAREAFHDYGTILTTATCTIEMDKYGCVRVQAPASGSFTVAFSGIPATDFAQGILIEAVNWGTVIPTLPTGKKWAGGTQPTFTAAGIDILRVYSRDNGTTWRWALVDKDTK